MTGMVSPTQRLHENPNGLERSANHNDGHTQRLTLAALSCQGLGGDRIEQWITNVNRLLSDSQPLITAFGLYPLIHYYDGQIRQRNTIKSPCLLVRLKIRKEKAT
jgi:hypothetical protein